MANISTLPALLPAMNLTYCFERLAPATYAQSPDTDYSSRKTCETCN